MYKQAYKMENDAKNSTSNIAGVGALGAGLYAAHQNQIASKAIGNSVRKWVINGAIAAGTFDVSNNLSNMVLKPTDLSKSTALRSAINIGQGSTIGSGFGLIRGLSNRSQAIAKRNKALALAAILGSTALAAQATKKASDDEKKIHRWENAKIHGIGDGAFGAGLGAIGGGIVGGRFAKNNMNPSVKELKYLFKKEPMLIKLLRNAKRPSGIAAGIGLGALLVGTASGASSALAGATRGYIIGSGANPKGDTGEYVENQVKRHAIAGAGLGALSGSVMGPGGMGIGGVNGALAMGTTGAISSVVGKYIKDKMDKKKK